MRIFLKILLKTVKWCFIAAFLFIVSLFFREQRISGPLVEWAAAKVAPTNLVISVESASVGFMRGVTLRGVRVYDLAMAEPTWLLAGAETIELNPFSRELRLVGARYTRLPDSYYAPGNLEKNAPVEATFPELGKFRLTLVRPDILAVRPAIVTAEVVVGRRRIDFHNIVLDWPDADSRKMSVKGRCFVDLDRQEVFGDIEGLARQAHIRPMLVAIDVPVALPYMDGFTEVPVPCPARCTWKVNLVRNDLDLWLDLHPTLGRYNGVPMKRADGKIHLHNYTRGTCLNYRTTVGPVRATDLKGRELEGSVTITGTNGYNVVDVHATCAQPIADVLKIGGFTGEYVADDVFGESVGDLQFRFPRAMTNNYGVLNGKGHVTVRNGRLMRLRGFKGLIEAMPTVAPAVTWFSDSTQASCDYVIENGVLRTDNIYIEGSLFSIKMEGAFDAVANKLDFTVRVQFMKRESFLGKIIHPLTWPFTKMLLEFKLTGSPDHPEWRYVSVVDRVMEIVK